MPTFLRMMEKLLCNAELRVEEEEFEEEWNHELDHESLNIASGLSNDLNWIMLLKMTQEALRNKNKSRQEFQQRLMLNVSMWLTIINENTFSLNQ